MLTSTSSARRTLHVSRAADSMPPLRPHPTKTWHRAQRPSAPHGCIAPPWRRAPLAQRFFRLARRVHRARVRGGGAGAGGSCGGRARTRTRPAPAPAPSAGAPSPPASAAQCPHPPRPPASFALSFTAHMAALAPTPDGFRAGSAPAGALPARADAVRPGRVRPGRTVADAERLVEAYGG
jgi:hypothetical protein